MPHSSGGGHGGGGHGGGFHGGHGGSGNSAPRLSRSYRPGYRRYSYMLGGRTRYVYGEEDDPLENDNSGNDEDDIFNPNVYGLMPDEDENFRDWCANHN